MFKTMRLSTIVIGTIGAMLVALVAWSLWAELDQITRAPGRVIPIARVQIVQSLEGGVIAKINVREGDRVKRGQVLVVLDQVKVQAAVDEARAKVAGLKTQKARIDAELFDRPISFPPDVAGYPDFVRNQSELYVKRRAALASELSSLRSMKTLLQEELDMNSPLVESGDVARSEIIRMQRSIVEVDGEMSSKRAGYIQDLQTELARTEEELVTAEQVLAQRLDSLAGTELVAPTDGIVKNVVLTTIGGVLRPGDEVLQIVPTGETLIVETQVAPRDIAFVKVGQPASVKFDTYDSSIYGAGKGTVSYISPDTLSEQMEDGRQNVYYRVNLEVDIRGMRPQRAGERIEIQPGMTASSEIITGQTTVFRYLTKPLTKTFSESLGER